MSNITINDLRKLIKEELEVVLTNDEVKEFFDVDIEKELREEKVLKEAEELNLEDFAARLKEKFVVMGKNLSDEEISIIAATALGALEEFS